MQRRKQILHFDDINHSHDVMGFTKYTDLHDFHIHTLEETYPSTRRMMPPYTFRFYCIMLLEENSQDAIIDINTTRLTELSNTISFQSPGHVSSWIRGEAQQGFLMYFQPEFLSHHFPPVLEDFPFFRPTEMSILSLTSEKKVALRKHFVHLEDTFKSRHAYRVPVLQSLLLALLYDCKDLYESYHLRQQSTSTKSSLATQFLLSLEQHYLTR